MSAHGRSRRMPVSASPMTVVRIRHVRLDRSSKPVSERPCPRWQCRVADRARGCQRCPRARLVSPAAHRLEANAERLDRERLAVHRLEASTTRPRPHASTNGGKAAHARLVVEAMSAPPIAAKPVSARPRPPSPSPSPSPSQGSQGSPSTAVLPLVLASASCRPAPKCPPAASASPPAMAMPRRERIGGAIANAGAEQGVERVNVSRSPAEPVEAWRRFQWRKAQKGGAETWNVFRKAERRRLRSYRPRKAPELLYFQVAVVSGWSIIYVLAKVFIALSCMVQATSTRPRAARFAALLT